MKKPVLVKTVGLFGLVPHLKVLTVHATRGTGVLSIVGLSDAAQADVRVRVRSALAMMGISLESFAICVTPSPSELTSSADLAIAVGILAALGEVPIDAARFLFIGELSLDGRLRPVRGLSAMWEDDIVKQSSGAIVPEENRGEAGLRPAAYPVMTAFDLAEVVSHLKNEKRLAIPDRTLLHEPSPKFDFADIPPGLPRRALEVAAAGGHNIHLVGGFGSQTMLLARRLPSILPRLTPKEQLKIVRIQSIAGLFSPGQRHEVGHPLRAPHHTVSATGLLGGGFPPRPGEMTLAHHGVLLLDDACEFRRSTLESMREGLSTGLVHLRGREPQVVFPSRFLLVASTFPCPCGYRNSSHRRCKCTEPQIAAYENRLVPLAPFLDLRVEVPHASVPELLHRPAITDSESTVEVRIRVTLAREKQMQRLQDRRVSVPLNGLLSQEEAERLAAFVPSLSLMRVAITLADLDGQQTVLYRHFAEASALTGQPFDQKETQHEERKGA